LRGKAVAAQSQTPRGGAARPRVPGFLLQVTVNESDF
jgi:hypothetical protein